MKSLGLPTLDEVQHLISTTARAMQIMMTTSLPGTPGTQKSVLFRWIIYFIGDGQTYIPYNKFTLLLSYASLFISIGLSNIGNPTVLFCSF